MDNLGWHDGKRRRKYLTRGTQAEVVRDLRRLTAAAETGRFSPGFIGQSCALESSPARSGAQLGG